MQIKRITSLQVCAKVLTSAEQKGGFPLALKSTIIKKMISKCQNIFNISIPRHLLGRWIRYCYDKIVHIISTQKTLDLLRYADTVTIKMLKKRILRKGCKSLITLVIRIFFIVLLRNILYHICDNESSLPSIILLCYSF